MSWRGHSWFSLESHGNQERFLRTGRQQKRHSYLQVVWEKASGEVLTVNFTLIPEKVKQIILETISTLQRGQEGDLEW